MNTPKILILSGEGLIGHFEVYKGKNTPRAIKMRLKKEACNGDRWSKAYIYTGLNDIYYDFNAPFERVHIPKCQYTSNN